MKVDGLAAVITGCALIVVIALLPAYCFLKFMSFFISLHDKRDCGLCEVATCFRRSCWFRLFHCVALGIRHCIFVRFVSRRQRGLPALVCDD